MSGGVGGGRLGRPPIPIRLLGGCPRWAALEDEDYDDEVEFESAEEVMDAIIALDDLHRAKKIPDEAYQLRRAELKELLEELA